MLDKCSPKRRRASGRALLADDPRRPEVRRRHSPRTALWPALLALVALVTCGGGDEDARERAEAALARGDRPAALEALASLRGSAPETAEALLELTDLMVRAGEAPEARWLFARLG